MALLALLLGGALLILAFGPQMWAKRVLARHHQPAQRFEFNGAQFARHLLGKHGLSDVVVEETGKDGDHYDPQARAVRLSPAVYNGYSLTAITIAAHECGHAFQHATNYRPLELRTRLVQRFSKLEKVGSLILMAAPLVGVVGRRPLPAFFLVLAGLLTMGAPALVHAVTLPVEFDASFNRAMPLLKASGHLHEDEEEKARSILRAAALTYVAASLNSLVNVGRWMRTLLRR
jgi:Zn-dependent membrane protease YugP